MLLQIFQKAISSSSAYNEQFRWLSNSTLLILHSYKKSSVDFPYESVLDVLLRHTFSFYF